MAARRAISLQERLGRPNYNITPTQLKQLRQVWGLTQQELANKIGVTTRTVAKYESEAPKRSIVGFNFAVYWMARYAIAAGVLPPETAEYLVEQNQHSDEEPLEDSEY